METFKHLYVSACEQIRARQDKNVMAAIDTDESDVNSELNLSSCLLNSATCKALGAALMKDVHLTHLDFSDCMLHEQGLFEILIGIESNTSLVYLCLKGNNIRSAGAQALGKMLRNNQHLSQLCLEWNALGILPEKFLIFCEGLAANASLKELDLRNNQLDHQCATSLANALQRNTTLKSLALHWNNLGLLGGRTILNCMFKNKTLVQLGVGGNNVPLEIEHGIDMAVLHNGERQVMSIKHAEEARTLASKLDEIEREKTNSLKELLETMEMKEQEASANQQMNSAKVLHLEGELAEKGVSLETLMSKYQELEAALSAAEVKQKHLYSRLGEMEVENHNLRIQHQAILSTERKERAEAEAQLSKDVKNYKEKIRRLEEQVEDLRGKEANQASNIQKFQLIAQKLEKQARMSEADFNEQMDVLKEKHDATLRESVAWRQKDVAKVRAEHEEVEEHLRQRIKMLEMQKSQLETEISDFKRELASQKVQGEQVLDQERQKMKSSENSLKNQLEEKLNLVQGAKDKQEKILKEQLQVMHNLQTKCTSLQYELDEQSHKVQHLEQVLEASKEESELHIAKVRLEVKEQLEELQENKGNNKKLAAAMDQMKQQLEESELSYTQEIKSKDDAIKHLQDKLYKQAKKMEQLVEEEARRAKQWQEDVMSYLSDPRHYK